MQAERGQLKDLEDTSILLRVEDTDLTNSAMGEWLVVGMGVVVIEKLLFEGCTELQQDEDETLCYYCLVGGLCK
jgi:hypothetical protein